MANDIVIGITLKANPSGFTGEMRAAEGQVQRFTQTAQQAATGANGLAEAIKRVGHYGSTYLGLSQFAGIARSVIEAQTSLDRFNNVMAIATGRANAGASEYLFVSQTAQRLGLEITSTAYAKFSAAARGTSMEGEGARRVFESVAVSAQVEGVRHNGLHSQARELAYRKRQRGKTKKP